MNKLSKNCTYKQYADFSHEATEQGLIIVDRGEYYEAIEDILSPDELKKIEIEELKSKLANSDYAVIKIAEGAATVEDYAELIAQRQAWRARINELEGE